MRLAVGSIAAALLAALCLASHLASTYEPPAQVPAPTEQGTSVPGGVEYRIPGGVHTIPDSYPCGVDYADTCWREEQ